MKHLSFFFGFSLLFSGVTLACPTDVELSDLQTVSDDLKIYLQRGGHTQTQLDDSFYFIGRAMEYVARPSKPQPPIAKSREFTPLHRRSRLPTHLQRQIQLLDHEIQNSTASVKDRRAAFSMLELAESELRIGPSLSK